MSSGKGKGKRSHHPNGNGESEKKAKYLNGSHAKSTWTLAKELTDPSVKEKFRNSWISDGCENVHICDSVTLFKDPFNCGSLKTFVEQDEEIETLELDLHELEFSEKNNDLYKFKQSYDLKSADSLLIKDLHKFLSGQVKPWLNEVTGIEFDDNIDMFCARYDCTDYLLCHDDELEGRRIAFIWYLVPESWNKTDGGALDLFDRDEDGHPRDVVQSLVPSRNSFAFFEVTPKSFHQVNEVLTRDKTRLSIGGWFHGTTEPWPQRPRPQKRPKESPGDIDEEKFFEWINPQYLEIENQMEIRLNFGASSEISLQDFLVREKYEQVCKALNEVSRWRRVGPANHRCYDVADADDVPEILQECAALFKSDAMFLTLSNITGLKLHELAPDESSSEEEDDGDDEKAKKKKSPKPCSSQSKDTPKKDKKELDPKCSLEIRRWSQGCYTLVRDDDDEQSEFALDARLFFNCENWSSEVGGFTSYVARNEDDELLSAQPEENALNLVYRDAETLKFVKRVTDEVSKVQSNRFFDISIVYTE